MRFIRWLGILIGVIVLGVVMFLVGARFADGPVIDIVAGGPLKAGELVTGPEPDWTFVHGIGTVELQLINPARSRWTWILEYEGKIYIPCGYMNLWWGRMWKHWPIEAERDGQALVRIQGKRYPRKLIRIYNDEIVDALTQQIHQKYGPPVTRAAVTSGALWLFELAPRNAS